MEKVLIRHFQVEVERQCQFAMIAFQDIEEASANSDGKLFWYSMQNLVVAVAGTGAVLLTLIMLSQLIVWQMVDESTLGAGDLTGTARTIMGLCYAPLLAWGPLLAAVTYTYYLRHRPLK
jgi:hypothetical protein